MQSDGGRGMPRGVGLLRLPFFCVIPCAVIPAPLPVSGGGNHSGEEQGERGLVRPILDLSGRAGKLAGPDGLYTILCTTNRAKGR